MNQARTSLPPKEYAFIRYLHSKKSVDERAFHRGVWQAFIEALSRKSADPMNIVEFGAGIGNMANRVIPLLRHRNISYRLIDLSAELLQEARGQLSHFLRAEGWNPSESDNQSLQFTSEERQIELHFVAGNALDWTRSVKSGEIIDALIAHAFMDLVDIDQYLQALRPLMAGEGLLYLPINFDGLTQFHPEIDAELEEHLMALYHQSMEAETQEEEKGGSQSGQKLLQAMGKHSFEVLESGRSDWFVSPQAGAYPGDEAYFLFHILKFLENELADHAELGSGEFAGWLEKRRKQIIDGELIFSTQQIDILACKAEK